MTVTRRPLRRWPVIVVAKHQGPGDHPSGTPQTVHGGGEGSRSLELPGQTLRLKLGQPFDTRVPLDPWGRELVADLTAKLEARLAERIARIEALPIRYTNLEKGVWGNDSLGEGVTRTPDGKLVPTPERFDLWDGMVSDFLVEQDADSKPKGHEAIIMAGLPGSGKSYLLETGAVPFDMEDFVVVNPDDFKERLHAKGLMPKFVADAVPGMEGAAALHEESSKVAKLAATALMKKGNNIVLDITAAPKADGSTKSVMDRMAKLEAEGYRVHVVLVNTHPNEAYLSTLVRMEEKGRYVSRAFQQELHRGDSSSIALAFSSPGQQGYKDRVLARGGTAVAVTSHPVLNRVLSELSSGDGYSKVLGASRKELGLTDAELEELQAVYGTRRASSLP